GGLRGNLGGVGGIAPRGGLDPVAVAVAVGVGLGERAAAHAVRAHVLLRARVGVVAHEAVAGGGVMGAATLRVAAVQGARIPVVAVLRELVARADPAVACVA